MSYAHRYAWLTLLVPFGVACTGPEGNDLLSDDPRFEGSALSAGARRERAAQIRDAARGAGLEKGWLLAGIADAETQMSHCHSELTWACRGPHSDDCGGPVVAGAGDGPCSARQGGLGMFQFDAGNYDQTLAREGRRVLSVAGNVAAAVDFVAGMVVRSTEVSGVDTRDQAIAWMNRVEVDGTNFNAWIRTVVRYYNGCRPGASCWSNRVNNYTSRTRGVYREMGAAFWGESSGTVDPPRPGPRPAPAPGGSCRHANGGTYGDLACSQSYQCCGGDWRRRDSGCGTCACVEASGATGCSAPEPEPMTPAPEPTDPPEVDPVPPPPAPSGPSCVHTFGGTYRERACSQSYQCCGGSWRARAAGCGTCACVETSGMSGC